MPTIHVCMEESDKKALLEFSKKHNRAVSRQALHYILQGIKKEEENGSENN